ncbi:hypothetical protein L6164_015016 [Bauhinia variegata]|uniref:Uncharacterized protein n=1 Tax=Bauhinia variegata TaxID=167791 RepID=A0ACB9NJE8_BAUVA|nr:hypothetical protein L6164_015016 [Bauhinia variegata]
MPCLVTISNASYGKAETGMGCESDTTQLPELLQIASDSPPSSAESSFRELDDAFLQTQTRIWLGEVLHIRLDEQLIISELLADGELLFQVSKVVWILLLTKHTELRHIKAYKNHPFSSKKNSGRYRPYSNVDSFLKICKILGLTGIDLFSPSDVVEKRNTRRVCMCIRSFSKNARAKSINVPDFDIVTYTVAMPKDMVGCIRRNLELSQSSHADSSSHYLQKHGGGKFRRDYLVRTSSRNYVTYSEDTDGFPDLDQADIQSRERNETSEQQSGMCSTESLQYHCSENVEHCCKLVWSPSPSRGNSWSEFSGTVSDLEIGAKQGQENGLLSMNFLEQDLLGNDDSFIENPMNSKTQSGTDVSHLVAISNLIGRGMDTIDPILFYEDNNILNALKSPSSSHGSNSTPGSIETGSRLFDVCDHTEELCAAGISCLSELALKLSDGFDAENNLLKVQCLELHNKKIDPLNKIIRYESQDIMKYKATTDSMTPDAVSSLSGKEFEETEHSLYSPDSYLCRTAHSGQALSHNNAICLSHVNLFRGNSNAFYNVSCNQSEALLSCESCSSPGFCKWDLKGKCILLSKGSNKHLSSPSSDSSEETAPRMQQNASDIVSSKVMLSFVPNDVEEVVSEAVVKLDSKCQQQDIDCRVIPSYVGIDYDAKYPKMDDDDENHFLDTHDIGDNGKQVLDITKDDVPSSNHYVVDPASADFQSCSSNECLELENVMDPIYHEEEIKSGDEGVVAIDESNETEEASKEIPKDRPKKKLLLKSVLGCTVAFGLLFAFTHLRRNGREKAGQSSVQSSHTSNDNNLHNYSSGKVQKKSKTHGVYPAEKLKLG